MKISDIPKVSRLSVAEKIIFVEELWDSIVSNEQVPVPQSHKAELDRRFAKHRGQHNRVLSLKELQTRIEKRK